MLAAVISGLLVKHKAWMDAYCRFEANDVTEKQDTYSRSWFRDALTETACKGNCKKKKKCKLQKSPTKGPGPPG